MDNNISETLKIQKNVLVGNKLEKLEKQQVKKLVLSYCLVKHPLNESSFSYNHLYNQNFFLVFNVFFVFRFFFLYVLPNCPLLFFKIFGSQFQGSILSYAVSLFPFFVSRVSHLGQQSRCYSYFFDVSSLKILSLTPIQTTSDKNDNELMKSRKENCFNTYLLSSLQHKICS